MQRPPPPPPTPTPGTWQVPDHLVLLHEGQELRPPGIAQLLVVEVETHGEGQVCSGWKQRERGHFSQILSLPAGEPAGAAAAGAFPLLGTYTLSRPE